MLDKNRKRAGLGLALMVAGGLLVLSALSLLLYNDLDDKRASENAARIAGALALEIKTHAKAGGGDKTISVDGEIYIGVLRIPALGLSLPVMRDWNYERLKISPCRYSGSADGDAMVIAAHNYRRHFGNIARLSPGDALSFTDADGNTTDYAVAEIETLEATAVRDMTESGYALTLFTCTYGGAARLALRCDRAT
jgi:sortase A